MKKFVVLATLATLASVSACHPPQSGDTLGESVRAYNEGVRWERFANAAIHVPPKERALFVDDADARAKDLRITDYELLGQEQKSDRIADVHVKMSWYLDSKGKLNETYVKQTWERHGKTWWIVDEQRIRGTEMPGIHDPEPEKSAAADGLREAPTQE